MMTDDLEMSDRRAVKAYRTLDFDQHRVQWDRWLKDAENAGASQISAHLNSFRAYRAQTSLHVIQDDDANWLAGVGLVSWKLPAIGAPFGVAIGGPAGSVDHWPQLLEGVSNWCRERKWMCLELSPHVAAENTQAQLSLDNAGFQRAPIFAPVSGLGADLRVPLQGTSEEQLMRSFRRQTRQHVQRSLQEGYQSSYPSSNQEIEAGIEFLYATAAENGIHCGPRNRFTTSVFDLIDSQTGYLVLVKHGDKPLAGGVLVRVGRSHSCYRLATRRDDKRRRAAYFLHWNAMLRARQEQADWYYLTGRSTQSVYQFKRGFRPQEMELLNSHRLVLRPALMRSAETIQPLAYRTARSLLGLANRLRGRG